jgi:hypothetical protein
MIEMIDKDIAFLPRAGSKLPRLECQPTEPPAHSYIQIRKMHQADTPNR